MSEKYEYPLPVLSADTDEISIETTGNFNGRLHIKNTGGGVLRGELLSRLSGLSFEPQKFEGNSQTINFTFNAQTAGLGIGESVSSRFFISTNGGEKEIPVTAKLTKMSISTPDGHTIANIRDFYEYSQKHPAQARRMFTDSEFYMLLLATGYKYTEVYESLHKDANRERAMDNFFVLSGLKGRTWLELSGEKRLEFTRTPGNNAKISGELKIKKSDSGYVEAPLNFSANWLSFSSGKLASSDFDEENTAAVTFTIDPEKITGSIARDEIIIGTDAVRCSAEIIYRRLPPFVLRLNRGTYRYSDRGTIEVTNNTGAPARLEIFCPESYIRFAAGAYTIPARGEIHFEIKLSAFTNAQMFFRKLPFMKANIEIKSDRFKKILPITIGEW
ncbi:MAG: DUF5717 family protein [Defluviitaleaceae bacterium]|nr:DUF5717 family protein [Defluviitaleaceae bacterium]